MSKYKNIVMIDINTFLYIIFFALYFYVLIFYYDPTKLVNVMIGIDNEDFQPIHINK